MNENLRRFIRCPAKANERLYLPSGEFDGWCPRLRSWGSEYDPYNTLPSPSVIAPAMAGLDAREACDVFAEASQKKYAAAKADGFFAGEILPVEVPGGRGGSVKVAEDGIRARRRTSRRLPA